MPIRGVQHDTDQIHGLSRNRRPGRRLTNHPKLWNLKHPPTPILNTTTSYRFIRPPRDSAHREEIDLTQSPCAHARATAAFNPLDRLIPASTFRLIERVFAEISARAWS